MFLFEDDIYAVPMQFSIGPSQFGGTAFLDPGTTNAVAMTVNTVTFLGVPPVVPAGCAYRLVGYEASAQPNNTGIIEFWSDVVGGLPFCFNVGPTRPSGRIIFPEPGILRLPGGSVDIKFRSNVASQKFTFIVYTQTDFKS
jgi:hypothetical protein